jgi:hypothetical protein
MKVARRRLDFQVTPLETWLTRRGLSQEALNLAPPTASGLLVPRPPALVAGVGLAAAAAAVTDRAAPTSRRGFLRTGSGLVMAGALAPVLMGNEGCPEGSIEAIFQAIAVLKAAYALAEQIGGTAVFKLSGDKGQVVELLLDLLGLSPDGEEVVDAGVVEPYIPADGQAHVIEYEGLNGGDPGDHQVKGESAGETRRTLSFRYG